MIVTFKIYTFKTHGFVFFPTFGLCPPTSWSQNIHLTWDPWFHRCKFWASNVYGAGGAILLEGRDPEAYLRILSRRLLSLARQDGSQVVSLIHLKKKNWPSPLGKFRIEICFVSSSLTFGASGVPMDPWNWSKNSSPPKVLPNLCRETAQTTVARWVVEPPIWTRNLVPKEFIFPKTSRWKFKKKKKTHTHI